MVVRLTLLLMLLCANPAAWCKAPEVGKPAPEITTTLLDGSGFDLATMSGKVVIVHFWATWCTPCREEMPVLEAFYRAHQAEGLVVVAISLDDRADLGKVRNVMRAFSYPASLLADTSAAGYGRIWHVPLTFAVDRHGVLRRDGFRAAQQIDAAVLDHDVLPLLHEP